MLNRRVVAALFFLLAFVLSGVSAFAQGQTVILDFSTGLAGAGGTITVSGGQATGAGIPVDFLIVSGAHGAPPAGLSYNVDGLGAPTGASDGTTGILEFSTSASSIRILGSIPSLGIAQGTLLQGTISDFQVLPSGVIITVVSVGTDTKSPALLNALGIPSNTPFQLFGFQVGAQMGGPAYTATNVDITNEAACNGGIGDFVWNDLNQNGIQDAGEPGIPNILVELWNSNQSVLLASQVTDAAGLYHFSGVCADTYKVVVPPQAGLTGWTASPTFVGSPATDSNGNPATVVLPPDTLDYTIDFGYFVRSPHLTLLKTPKNGTFFQGDPVSFSFVVGNDGGSPALNVKLSDQLPGNGGLVWMVAAVSQPSCSVSGGNLLTCNFGTIAAGQTATVTVTSVGGTPLAACQAQPNPIAIATADGGLNATDSGSLNCVPPQLSIVKTPDGGTFTLGGMVSFKIVVSNPAPAGASPATHVVLTDTLPNAGGLVWDTATPSQGTCTLTSNNLSCALGTIAPGGSVTVIVNSTATTPAAACQSQPNPVARATADGNLDVQDSGSLSCTFTASTTLTTKTVTPGTTVAVGTPVTITVTETNTGNTAITNVNITGTGCTAWTPASVASLAAGASTDFSCTFTPATTAGWTATGHGTDILGQPVSEDGETTSGTVTVFTASTVLTTKTVSPGTTVIVGTPVTITVTEKNTGNSTITNVNVTGTGCTTWIPASVASLAAGASVDFSCTFTPVTATTTNWTATGHGKDVNNNDVSLVGETTSGTVTATPPPMTATCVAASVGQVGVPYASSIGVVGGTAPYTFSLASGSLPGGLSLNVATGAVTGTPTTAGAFSFSVMVTDSTPGVHAVATTSNCGITIAPPPPTPCVPGTFTFTGNTATSGTAGNIRPFSITGVNVKASAFSRTDVGGTWNTAYLGLYGPGLGVTDGSEGDGSNNRHKVDNIGGRDNYVMFEFSTPVIINRAFLDYIGTDSDIAVWIGTKTDPYNNHQTLSDAFLAGMTREENLTAATVTSRWADINGSALSGNVIVIAALDNDDTPEDEFKISKLELECPTPPPVCSGKIGDRVWSDTNNNGIQDSGEVGIAGVSVQLKNGSTVLATTTTDSNGNYLFTGLCAGTYTVTVTAPTGYSPSPNLAGTNRSIDSNANPSTVVLAANDSSDLTIDFGYAPTAPCVARTFTFSGDTATSGTAGNIRTFTVSGVSVKASAFSRTDSAGTWNTAYLGLYGPGLGVTDGSESGTNNTHKVDNMGGRDNYVLFEFSSPVTLNRAFLDAIGTDSDISVWIGTKTDPFNNHITLSDGVLGTLAYEQNETASTVTSRWADINSGNLTGNVVVISALANDTSPEDEFKISKLETSCPTGTCSGVIGSFVWKDTNGNGIQNSTELGIAGVTVQLKKNGTLVATTTTSSSGYYQFTGLCAGTYTVVIPTTPTGTTASPSNVGSDRSIDSNGSGTTVVLSTSSTSDLTVDFGFIPPASACVNTQFTFTGNTSTTGTSGNSRTFTVNGISVKVTAFSRTTGSGGTWSTAYLGLYGPGLGVTDGSESGTNGSHKVDNIGRYNYVMFEFSAPVVVNQAFLDSIANDADLSTWIGTKSDPFNNHLTLSDSLLSSLTYEENPTSSTGTSRWADFNNVARSGNVLVLAAMVTDTTPEDEFKISKIDITCP